MYASTYDLVIMNVQLMSMFISIGTGIKVYGVQMV